MEYSLTKTNNKCPLCSSEEGLLLFETNSEEVAMSLISFKKEKKFKEIKKHIENLWKKKKCRKVLCSECSMIYAVPFVGGDSRFYNLLYEKPTYPLWKWDYEITLQAINKLPKKEKKSYLEIGSGRGAFIRKISPDIIPKNNVLCLEYASSGIQELERLGFKHSKKNFLKLKTKKKYSIVCLFQVLEHMDNLDKIFKKLKEITPTNANIFITIPSTEKMLFHEQRMSMLDLPPTHINWLNKKSFEFICKKYNFKLTGFKQEPPSFFRGLIDWGLGNFQRKKLQRKSISNKIDSIKNKKIRKIFIFLFLISKLPFSLTRVLEKKLPQSQWIHLKK